MNKFVIAITLSLLCIPIKVKAAEAYWLDHYNALLYLGTFRLDAELRQMKEKGSSTLLLHADSLPPFLSRYIAWRAKVVGNMDSIAWIQKPSKKNLNRAANLTNFKGVQIDDHYFNKPPVSLVRLKKMLNQKELWCSFQPRQYSQKLSTNCDQSDVQLYRYGCKETGDLAWKMGITGNSKIKVAAYDDGTPKGTKLVKCIENDLKGLGTGLFVFKWKNQEAWFKKVFHIYYNFSIK